MSSECLSSTTLYKSGFHSTKHSVTKHSVCASNYFTVNFYGFPLCIYHTQNVLVRIVKQGLMETKHLRKSFSIQCGK
jgi:hypothetical protein